MTLTLTLTLTQPLPLTLGVPPRRYTFMTTGKAAMRSSSGLACRGVLGIGGGVVRVRGGWVPARGRGLYVHARPARYRRDIWEI